MRNITITKAKLDKENNLTVEFTEQVKDGQISVTQECTAEPHEDLVKSFRALDPHLASLCDQYTLSGEISAKVECRSFSLSGDDDKKGVVLSGGRTVMETKFFALNTPFICFLRDAKNYPAMDDLEKALLDTKQETYKYLVEGKHKPTPQLDIFDAEKNEEIAKQAAQASIIPENVANQMIAMADIDPSEKVLLSNLGDGTLLKAIKQTDKAIKVDFTEPTEGNIQAATGIPDATLISRSVTTVDRIGYYDTIIGNPSHKDYAAEVQKMYELLVDTDGVNAGQSRLITLLPAAASKNQKFNKWLNEVGSQKVALDNKQSNLLLVIIDK